MPANDPGPGDPGPGDPGPDWGLPGRRSLLGDADRDRLLAVLREHYVAGRLSLDELRRRAGIVLAAEYAGEVTAVIADLPPAGVPSQSPRRRQRGRHAQATSPEPGWVPTAERFRDPSSGAIMRVWVNPADQSRHYVPDDGC